MSVTLQHQVPGEKGQQSPQHGAVAMGFFDGKQAQLGDLSAGGQKRIEVFELEIEGEGAFGPGGEHAYHAVVVQANGVSVLAVELVDQSAVRVDVVLGDFFDEGLVIEPVDLIKFGFLVSDFEF
ncbi:MAG: hypothetical protein M1608_01230 [Candidatus Omnitrophica bacterium]|nr:hypothetical protein [Candidatus Omnitrophota bacterium]